MENNIDQQVESQYLALFDNSLDGIAYMEAIYDRTGRMVDCRYIDMNTVYVSFLPVSKNDAIGKRVLEILPNTEQAWFDTFSPVVRDGKQLSFEMFHETTNRWYKVMCFRPEGNRDAFVGIFEDITQQKKSERELIEKNKSLKALNKDLEQFVYIASHDLQEPLNTILSYSSLLTENNQSVSNDNNKEYIQIIEETSYRMKDLILGLLEYSRIGINKTITEVDLNKLLDDIKIDLSELIKNTQTEIHYNILPNVNAYETDLRMLFMNLITNAIKFSEDTITPKIEIQSEIENSHIQFSVNDNGIGIEPEYHDDIFNIFQRLHTRREYEGTGIGLSHCKKIVDLHGGEIWVESEKGQGSKFSFTLSNKL